MKTTLWVQIVKTFTDNDGEHTTIENLGHEADSWEEAFTKATADYFYRGWVITSDETVSWFKISIVNKNMAVEHGMTSEWSRPVAPTPNNDETPESEG